MLKNNEYIGVKSEICNLIFQDCIVHSCLLGFTMLAKNLAYFVFKRVERYSNSIANAFN